MEDKFDDFFDKESLSLFDRFQEEYSNGKLGFYDSDEYVILGSVLITLGQFEKAVFLLERALEQCPDSVDIKLKRAELSLEMDLFDDSLRRLAEVEETDPFLHELYLIKGHALRAKERYAEAKDTFEKALSLGANPLEVNLGMAEIAAVWPEMDLWTYLQKTLGSESDTTDTCNRFIELATKGNLLPEALGHVRAVLKEHPYELMYWKTLAELADAAQAYEQAIEADEFVLAIDPADKESMWHKLVMIDKLGSQQSYLDYYKSIEPEFCDEPDYVKEIRVRIAREYEGEGAWEEALNYYGKLHDLPEMRQFSLFRTGVIFLFQGRFRTALMCFEHAMGEGPEGGKNQNMAKLFYACSRAHYYMGNADAVLEMDIRSVETDPANPSLFFNLAADAIICDKIRDAMEFLQRNMELFPSAGAHVAYGTLLMKINRKDEAYAHLALGFQEIPQPSVYTDPRFYRFLHSGPEVDAFLNALPGEIDDVLPVYDDYLFFGPELPFGSALYLEMLPEEGPDHRRFGLLGYPLGHSFSVTYFSRKFENEGLDCEYRNYEFEHIGEALTLLQFIPGLRGLNVTIPHKKTVIPYLDRLSPQARSIGAVNVIRIHSNGDWEGHNTDCIGFQQTLIPVLQRFGYRSPRENAGIKALVLGNGGASQAIQYVLHHLGIPYHLVCRKPESFTAAEDFNPISVIGYMQLDDRLASECRLWVNTTSLGMYPDVDRCPDLPYDVVTAGHIAYDVVYNPQDTLFLRKCRERGANCIDGMGMLLAQAEAAWKIWNGDYSSNIDDTGR